MMADTFMKFKRHAALVKYPLLLSLLVGLIFGCRSDPQTAAERLLQQGKYREAIGRLERMVQREERAHLFYLLGKAYGGLMDFYQADSYYRKALSSDSTLRVPVLAGYLALGEGLLNLKEEALAVRSFERILALEPDYDLGEHFYSLGDHHFRNQDYGRASRLYSRALITSPLSPLADDGRYRLVVSLERLGRLEEALGWCTEDTGKRNPDLLYEEGKIAYSLAEKFLRDGDEEAALRMVTRTIRLGQPRILLDDAHFLTGEIHFRRGEYGEALSHYKEVLKSNPYQRSGVTQKAKERIKEISSGNLGEG